MSDDAVVFKVEGLGDLAQKLDRLAAQCGSAGPHDVAWVFGGPAAPYAIYVHENLEAHHSVGGPLFLTGPLFEAIPNASAEIARLIDSGLSIDAAVRTWAELRMTEMKRVTPVEYGTLRESGHVVQR